MIHRNKYRPDRPGPPRAGPAAVQPEAREGEEEALPRPELLNTLHCQSNKGISQLSKNKNKKLNTLGPCPPGAPPNPTQKTDCREHMLATS